MLITKIKCITVPTEAYRSNAMFKCGNAAEFLGSILHHANSFSML